MCNFLRFLIDVLRLLRLLMFTVRIPESNAVQEFSVITEILSLPKNSQ